MAIKKASRACPSGYTLVNGKCVSTTTGKEASYPYVSPSGAYYPDAASMAAGKPGNPAKYKDAIMKMDTSKMNDAQKKALGIQKAGGAIKKKAGGATSMMKKKAGGLTSTMKKMKAGGSATSKKMVIKKKYTSGGATAVNAAAELFKRKKKRKIDKSCRSGNCTPMRG